MQSLQNHSRSRAPFFEPYKDAGESYSWYLTLIEAEPLDRFGYQAAHLKTKSPNVEAPAPRVFHLNRHDPAPRVIHLDGCATVRCALAQALAPGVFHLNYHTPEHAPAARVFRFNRRDLAPRIFHLHLHAIR